LRRLSDSDTLRDEIFNLQARNASLTERLSSLVGGDLDLHEEVTQCRALLARKDAELNELNELFCSIEDEVARARTERDDAQAHAARAEDAAAAAAGEKAEAAGRASAA
jgi:chromosome segregation ATPase